MHCIDYGVLETIKTADYGYMRVYGYRKTHDYWLGLWSMLYAGPVCDDSVTEVAYAAVVSLYRLSLPLLLLLLL